MAGTKDGYQLSRLGTALGELDETLLAAQVKAGAIRLVEAMVATTDTVQMGRLGWALEVLGEKLPAAQDEAGSSWLIEAMNLTRDCDLFIQLAEGRGAIQVRRNAQALETVPDLLQAPMAFGETQNHLLRYYSRLWCES